MNDNSVIQIIEPINENDGNNEKEGRKKKEK